MFNAGYGANDETLKGFGLSLRQVVESAIRTQETARNFMPRSLSIMQTIIGNIGGSKEEVVSTLGDTFFINIPICDLSDIELTYHSTFCEEHDEMNYYESCLNSVIREACVKYSIDGHKWPYTL